MSYCRAADDSTLTEFDIQGAQAAYGKRTLSADSDHDGRPDYFDNCPYVPNYDQADSNYESELQTAIDNGYQNVWGTKEGLPPSATDTDAASGYVTHWRAWYPGDACDPTPVSIVQDVAKTTTVATGPCVDVYIGGVSYSSIDYNPKPPCPYTVNTGLRFDGIVSDANGGTPPQMGRSGPSYCDCPFANDPDPTKQARCTDPSNPAFQCLYARDNLFPPFNNTQPLGSWGRITEYSPGGFQGNKYIPASWGPFTDVSTSFARPFWNYVSKSSTLVWDFAGSGYSPNDLVRYGHAQTDTSMAGLLWSHVTNFPTTPPVNKANYYFPITAQRSYGARYHWTPPFAPNWHPIAWLDPGPLRFGPVTYIAYVPTATSTMAIAMRDQGSEDSRTSRCGPRRTPTIQRRCPRPRRS